MRAPSLIRKPSDGGRSSDAAVQRLERSRHAAPQVLDRLRERIVALDLPPGIVLSRAELAATFGISQTPVRDALMRLEEEGLVDVFPQHQTVVSRIDVARATQAHFLRRAIELEVVRTLAARDDPALVKRLRATIERQRTALAEGDYPEFVACDQAFHRQMYEAAGVPGLWDEVRRRSGHIDRLRRLHLPVAGKGETILRDHARIADAVAKRDADRAQRRVREHLSGTLAHVDAIRARYPDYLVN
ncbi:MAG TPA: GntR family transcriptional regulator [Casimicrobiaceae bacterium]|nr:GntR family transcriptional regulator [Casimicrobiaceae bacterium]